MRHGYADNHFMPRVRVCVCVAKFHSFDLVHEDDVRRAFVEVRVQSTHTHTHTLTQSFYLTLVGAVVWGCTCLCCVMHLSLLQAGFTLRCFDGTIREDAWAPAQAEPPPAQQVRVAGIMPHTLICRACSAIFKPALCCW